MTEKELRKLSRSDLLELLINQVKENKSLRVKLEKAEKELDDIKITVNSSGSLAEAALKLSGVFDDAQQAADIYMKNLEKSCHEKEQECFEKCERLMRETKARCDRYEEQILRKYQTGFPGSLNKHSGGKG